MADSDKIEKHICDYGCGQIAICKFKSGNWSCSKSPNSCPKVKERNGSAKRGKPGKKASKETKEKLRIIAKSRIRTKTHCENLSKSLTGKKLSKERVLKGVETARKNRQIKKLKILERLKNGEFLCENGCGLTATVINKAGKFRCNENPKKCPVVTEKYRNAKLGKSKSESHKRNMSLAKKGKPGKPKSEQTKLKLSLKNKNKKRTPEFCENCRKRNIGKVQSEEAKNKKRIKSLEKWKDPKYVESLLASLSTENGPNKPEQIIIKILEEIFYEKNNYKYTGNGTFWINRKNPDFVNKEEKKIIEHFGDYFHDREYRIKKFKDYSTNEEHSQNRINLFKEYGFDCLIIWEFELKDIERVKEKIKNFHFGENNGRF